MTDAEQIHRFCSALFGGPDGNGDDRLADLHVAAAWSIPGRETRWRQGHDLAAIVSAITELAEEQGTPGGAQGIYLGPGMTRMNKGRYKRAKADEVVAIPGLWADIDVAGGPHESKAYPPDISAAISIANATGAVPTAIIRTGFGIQAWWLFHEPLIIDPENEEANRKELAQVSQDWASTLSYHAERLGQWKIDSVFDLSRVLRVPGTMNLKVDGDPRMAEIHAMDESVRYELDDLVEVLADDEVLRSYAVGTAAAKAISLDGVNLSQIWARVNSAAYRESRHTPEWLQAVLDIDEETGPLSQAWTGNRRDLGKDQSSYEASVARILHDYGFSTEHQIEAVMCLRLRSGEKVDKVDPRQRVDYIARTIGFVQESAAQAKKPTPLQVKSEDAFESAASGRLASTVDIDPEPRVEDYDWTGREAPPEDEDPYGDYVADVIEHSANIATPGERVAAAEHQVEQERGLDPLDREQPAPEVPAGLEPDPTPAPDAPVWGERSPEMALRMRDLSDLLFHKSFRDRGFEIWRLERQDQGEGARARIAVRVPVDYDWPQSNRPENYRVNRPLFSEWDKRAAFDTPRGFRNAVMKDCLIPALPVASKEEWSALIDLLVPYWLRDSSGGDIAYAVHGWLLDYLVDHPATPDGAEALDMRKPYMEEHNDWGRDGLPVLLFAMDPFLQFVATRGGGVKGRQAKGQCLRYLHVEATRPRILSHEGKKLRPSWYRIEHSQFNADEWAKVILAAHEAYNTRENRRSLKLINGGAS